MAVGTRVVDRGDQALFLLGYGLNFEQPGSRWIVSKFASAGIGTTFVTLPTEIDDFTADILDPCREIESGMGKHVLLGLSLGGMTAAFLERSEKRIFLSPFWGVNDAFRHRGFNVALNAMKNIRYRWLPRRFPLSEAGHFAVEEDLEGIPEHISFKTVHQMVRMQEALPPPREGDVVYRSMEDHLISHHIIDGRKVQIIEYEGGHLIHLVKEREQIFGDIVGTIRESLK